MVANAPATSCGSKQSSPLPSDSRMPMEKFAPVFQAGQILVCDASTRGQFILGQVFLLTQTAHETPNNRLGIHFNYTW